LPLESNSWDDKSLIVNNPFRPSNDSYSVREIIKGRISDAHYNVLDKIISYLWRRLIINNYAAK
jgi:hypothetical protein